MSVKVPATEHSLSEAVAGMGAALLKTLPARRWVHDRAGTAWGDLAAFESGDVTLRAPQALDFTEMTA